MPAILEDDDSNVTGLTALPFPPVTKQHILQCSLHSWYPRYRTITPKTRLIPLSKPFLDYLRADGIILPSENEDRPESTTRGGGGSSHGTLDCREEDDDDDDSSGDDDEEDIAAAWRNIHNAIKTTIGELGGKVFPKLNWSAPKDATWMNSNTMECRSPNDIYLLLKSSDFITHDLEHAFDETIDSTDTTLTPDSIPYYLALRKAVLQFNTSMEFRCFVRRRRLLCMCQRDLNYFPFLSKMSGRIRSLIKEFFEVRMRDTFPAENFAFDVYIPAPQDRVWLIDINPWAPRTDPLLFSWMEILNMPEPPEVDATDDEPDFVRLSLHNGSGDSQSNTLNDNDGVANDLDPLDSSSSDSDVDEEIWLPELRLVQQNDPEARGSTAPQYSAHKLPKDVVDAAQSGEGLRDFVRDWREILARRQSEDGAAGESSDDE